MKLLLPDTWPQFYTATASAWRPLFEPAKYKDIIIDSLRFLVHKRRIVLYGFVIMINHIHVIWQAVENVSGNIDEPVGENNRPWQWNFGGNIDEPAGDNTRPGQVGNVDQLAGVITRPGRSGQ